MRTPLTRWAAALALTLGAPLAAAQAPTVYQVNSVADDANAQDANPGDGQCLDANDRCTLRAAVTEANYTRGVVYINLPGQLAGGNSGNYTLSRVAPNNVNNTYEDANQYGDLDIGLLQDSTAALFDSLAIRGTGTPGPSLTVSPNDRVVDIHGLGDLAVSITRVTISGGNSRPGQNGSDPDVEGIDGQAGADGGGIRITEGATVLLDQLSLNNNKTGSGGNGAAPSSGPAAGGDGGSGGNGAGLANFGVLTIRRSFVAQNTAGDGGGAASGVQGGGSADGGNGGPGGSGAGIYNEGTLTVEDVTIFGNLAGSPSGGAGGQGPEGTDGFEGEGGAGAGIATVNGGTVMISGSIVAGNTAGDDVDNAKQPGSDVYNGAIADDDGGFGSDTFIGPNPFESPGTFTSMGYNLIGTNNSVEAAFPASGGPMSYNANNDIVGTGQGDDPARIDPDITGANQNQPYAVLAYELGANSPAVDAGDPARTDSTADGRGYLRPTDGDGDDEKRIDIGAFEDDSQPIRASLVVNEVDSITEPPDENDAREFVEIKNVGAFTAQLADYAVVLYNGASSASYNSFNLQGELAPGDIYTIGDPGVMGVDLVVLDGAADDVVDRDGAVGLYNGKASDYPSGSAAGQNADTRVDVLVYQNADDQGSRFMNSALADAFNVSQDNVATGDDDDNSIQRNPDGSYSAGPPSAGADGGDPNQNDFTGRIVPGSFPDTVPASGGRFRVGVEGTNNFEDGQRFTVFIRLVRPDGSQSIEFRGEVKPRVGQTVSANLPVRIRKRAAAGEYTLQFLVALGSASQPETLLDEITFVKEGGDGARVGAIGEDDGVEIGEAEWLYSSVAEEAAPAVEATAFQVGAAYPNPSSGRLRVDVRVGTEQAVTAEVFDVLGRLVRATAPTQASAQTATGLEVGGLAPGLYLLRVTGADQQRTQRITVAQ